LSGVGSIVFRDEESITAKYGDAQSAYQKHVAPFKGELETWYVVNRSLKNYFMLISLTLVAIALPNAQLIWRLYKALPPPPDALREVLNYSMSKTSGGRL